MRETVRQRIEESIDVKQGLLLLTATIEAVALELIRAYHDGRKVILFGNGGSAADAQHIAAEFVGRYYMNRRALPAIALTENVSSLTAIGNDYAFDAIFSRQVEALGNLGDVAIGLSTSGHSSNVIRGLAAARRLGLVTVGLTGADGGRLAHEPAVAYCLRVPSRDTPRIQEAHTLLCHIWSELVEEALFGRGVRAAGAVVAQRGQRHGNP
jgi:D-sedoheptulose 7-phosphate isomerase